jgi:hypothetical protein
MSHLGNVVNADIFNVQVIVNLAFLLIMEVILVLFRSLGLLWVIRKWFEMAWSMNSAGRYSLIVLSPNNARLTVWLY